MNTIKKKNKKVITKRKMGFACMSEEQKHAIASKGGIAAHKKGKAHEWTQEEAKAAGKKGGETRRNRAAKKQI